MQILIVEDEKKLAATLQDGLTGEGFVAEVAHTGEEAFFLIKTKKFDLLLLDIMLPGHDGIAILRAVREENAQLPVIMLTAKDTLEDKIIGLDSGADDYLVKPFDFPELLARIRSRLRRRSVELKLTYFQLADLELDKVSRQVKRHGQVIELTNREFDLLAFLFQHQGSLVSREMLTRNVWNISKRATPIDNVIDVHMNRLRKKVDDPFVTKLIKTVRGVGFVLEQQPL